MLNPQTLNSIQKEIKQAVIGDEDQLNVLRSEVQGVKSSTRQIRPHSATTISLVGTDGGNNQIVYDPFMIQLIRVVDSSQNEHCLEVVTPYTNLTNLTEKQIECNSVLWQMMKDLSLSHLTELSPVFKEDIEKRATSWVQVYREMNEWAVLYSLVKKDYGTDTLIVFDGFLRSKMFKGGLFNNYIGLINKEIERNFQNNKRRIYIVGLAKHTKILQTYSLAMALEGAMREKYSCYAKVPEKLKQRAYKWSESHTGGAAGEGFVAGEMYLVKFGSNPHDPIWAVDILKSQDKEAAKVFGYMLADAKEGFPIPFYPQCLQKAHENAAIVDFDMDILQDEILVAIRDSLGEQKPVIDELALQAIDPSSARY